MAYGLWRSMYYSVVEKPNSLPMLRISAHDIFTLVTDLLM
jgi:hypothetical protein